MTFSGVPWVVGGGAVIPEDVARMIPYFMFNKTEGVLGATDLQVLPLATPGGSVRVSPGGFVVLGRGSGQFYEAYMGKNSADHVLAVAANNTASPRSDLVIARVIDPYVAGSPWNVPADRANGPYVEPAIVSGVPSTTRTIRSLGNNWSAIDLARIDIPANTATITQAMIVSLRNRVSAAPPQVPPPSAPPPVQDVNIYIDNPENSFFTLVPGPSTAQNFPSASKNVWRNWPLVSEIVVPIPKWATIMDAQFSLLQAHTDNDVWGEARIEVGSGELYSGSVVYDFNKSTGGERIDIYAGGRMAIPSSMQGMNKRFRVNCRSLDVAPAEPGTMYVDRGSLIRLEVVFKEQVS